MSRLHENPGFSPHDLGNTTGAGVFHLELARILHDDAFGSIWDTLGRGTIRVPVGTGKLAVQQSGAVIPPLVPTTITEASAALPPAIDRRDIPQNTAVLQPDAGGQMRYTVTLPGGRVVGQLSESGANQLLFENPGAVIGIAAPVQLQQPEEENMDLGDIFGGLYDTVDTAVGGILPGGVPFGTTPATTVAGALAPTVAPAPSLPTVQVTAPAARHQCYKLVNGQWVPVQKRKRKRKRLATPTDIKDLAALAGVVGKGKLMEVWIATHS